MSQRPKLIDISEPSETPLQTSLDETNLESPISSLLIATLFNLQRITLNTKVLASRFTQLMRRPEQMAPLILDAYSLSVSFLFNSRESGVDFFYPMSSLRKRQSGRLARLILEHSRGLQQHNIHEASSHEDIAPPCVAVIDLGEVPRDIIERQYSVPADIHGSLVVNMILQIFLALWIHILFPIDTRPVCDWIDSWASRWFGEPSTIWIGHLLCLAHGTYLNWSLFLDCFGCLCTYAVLRGEAVITLLQRSAPFAPGYAVFLHRGFTVILTGNRSVVEAIAESSFSISYPISWNLHQKAWSEAWNFCQRLCYASLKYQCRGIFFALFLGFWLLVHPPSRFVPVAATYIIFALRYWAIVYHTISMRGLQNTDWVDMVIECMACLTGHLPTLALIFAYEMAIQKVILFGLGRPILVLHYIAMIPFFSLLFSSRNFPIRTSRFLEVLGNPPVRRWEFDTPAAATTFQCLVLCHSIPRPIKTINVFALLDTLLPDQTEIWMIWKKRVADRIAHEVDISFAPTLPSFGDQRQKDLKNFLDQAQLGYCEYRRFYNDVPT